MTRLLLPLALALALGACGGKLSLEHTVRVDGDAVVVTVTCSKDAVLGIGGVQGACKAGEPVDLRVPTHTVGAGKHRLDLVGFAPGDERNVRVAVDVDVPAAADVPALGELACKPSDAPPTLAFTRDDGGRGFTCADDGFLIEVFAKANPRGKITLATTTLEVPDSGLVEGRPVDLGPAVLDLPLTAFLDKPDAVSITVPWTVTSEAGAKARGTLTATPLAADDNLLGRWLAAIAEGRSPRPAFAHRPGDTARPAALVDTAAHFTVRATNKEGAVRDLGLVAVLKESARAERGTCDVPGGDGVVTARRDVVELTAIAFSTDDGREVARRTFIPPAEACPTDATVDPAAPAVTVRVADDEVLAWLATVATPGD